MDSRWPGGDIKERSHGGWAGCQTGPRQPLPSSGDRTIPIVFGNVADAARPPGSKDRAYIVSGRRQYDRRAMREQLVLNPDRNGLLRFMSESYRGIRMQKE